MKLKSENRPFKYIFKIYLNKFKFPEPSVALDYLQSKLLEEIKNRLKSSDENGVLADWQHIDRAASYLIV